jgi:hypothetical protein
MEYPKANSKSLFDYSDKSVQHAGYAAIAYAAILLFSGLLAWIQFFLYHRPGRGGWIDHGYLSQQWVQHTPRQTAITVVFSVVLAAISGVLAFGIFRRRRGAIVAMIVFVVALQLFTWFVARSIGGALITIIVVAFLLRGAKRMFQDHTEREMEAGKGLTNR